MLQHTFYRHADTEMCPTELMLTFSSHIGVTHRTVWKYDFGMYLANLCKRFHYKAWLSLRFNHNSKTNSVPRENAPLRHALCSHSNRRFQSQNDERYDTADEVKWTAFRLLPHGAFRRCQHKILRGKHFVLDTISFWSVFTEHRIIRCGNGSSFKIFLEYPCHLYETVWIGQRRLCVFSQCAQRHFCCKMSPPSQYPTITKHPWR